MPRLDGALCVAARGRFWEAENGNRVRVRECIAICHQCPCLARCRELDMPYRQRRNRSGVWAGTFYGRENETESETGQDNE
ncbi:WhiB family transcriptional regulator [Mycobacterium sp. NPDC051198]